MAYYRTYFLDSASGRFTGFAEFDARSDREAIAITQKLQAESAMELWNGSRMVRCWGDRRGTIGSRRTASGAPIGLGARL